MIQESVTNILDAIAATEALVSGASKLYNVQYVHTDIPLALYSNSGKVNLRAWNFNWVRFQLEADKCYLYCLIHSNTQICNSKSLEWLHR